MKEEIWKDIPGYEGIYQVSDAGRVKSLPRVVWNGNGYFLTKERFLKAGLGGNGYLLVHLCKNRKQKSFSINVLVAMAFLNHIPCGNKVVVDHIDNDKLNNKLENLQLITQRKNLSKDKNGTSKYTGVSWNGNSNKWESQIKINNKSIYLGRFIDEEEAGRVYQIALKNLHLYNGDAKEFRDKIKSLQKNNGDF